MQVDVAFQQDFSNQFGFDDEPRGIYIKLDAGQFETQADGTIAILAAALAINNALGFNDPANPTVLTSDVNGSVATIDLGPAIAAGETQTVMDYDETTTVLTYTGEDGVLKTFDLSALTTDIYMNGHIWDPGTMTLTLQDNDAGTPDVVIDLASLKVVETADTDTIAFSGQGTAADPLTANLKIDPAAGNDLTSTPDGARVDVETKMYEVADVAVFNAFGTTQYGWLIPVQQP